MLQNMEESQIHAIAVLLHQSHGAKSLDAAWERANILAHHGQVGTAGIWKRVAAEVSVLERLNNDGLAS